MDKRTVWSAGAAAVMIGGPFLAVNCMRDTGMGVFFLLFFCVDPLFCGVCGAAAGRDIKRMWWLPMASAGLFVAGTWLFFEMGEPDFLRYAAVYLVIGTVSMLLRSIVRRYRPER